MLNKIKLIIQKIKCKHNMQLIRWHWVHYLEQPLSVEAEYICPKCNKVDYLHLFGEEANQWALVMGDFKKV